MGGPSNLDEVGLFLKNMFDDRYILPIKNDFIRKTLSCIITFFRKNAAKKNYIQIGSKSPINEITIRLCKKINEMAKEIDGEVVADYAMNYTPPFADEVVKKYRDFDEIILFPLYPHHSKTTVDSSLYSTEQAIAKFEIKAKIKVVPVFYDDENYNKILLKLIADRSSDLSSDEIAKTDIVFSAHSLPKKNVERGDIYQSHIEKHFEILSALLRKNGLNFKNSHLAYQSKLGPVEWLTPNLSHILPMLESKRAIVVPLSFCIDNSESDYELAIEYAKLAKVHGFDFYEVVKCPNDSDEFAKFILQKALSS